MEHGTSASGMYSEVFSRLVSVKPSGKGWTARCPAHEDKHESLYLRVGKSGDLIAKCMANHGCTFTVIAAALGVDERAFWKPREPRVMADDKRKWVESYDYRDESGVLLYQVVRWEPKGFSQRRPKEPGTIPRDKSGWEWNLEGVRKVLYRLPELISADPAKKMIFVVEGEKDVHSLEKMGLVATTCSGGAGKWLPEYSAFMSGRKVTVIPDADQPGFEHAKQVAEALAGVAADVRILVLPGLESKQDVSDWLAAGGTSKQLHALVRARFAAAATKENEPCPADLIKQAAAEAESLAATLKLLAGKL